MPPAQGLESDYCPLILRWERGRKNDSESCVEWLIDSVFMPGEETALLPCRHNVGPHRYVPVDFRGKIMNLALFRGTKTEGVDTYGSLEKALLNNYHLSDCLPSATPSDLECLLTKQTLSIGLLSS